VLEPVLHITLLSVIFALVMHGSPPIGTEFFIFYFTGLVPYHVFVHASGAMGFGIIGNAPLLQLPLVTTFDDHPWAWARQEEGERTPRKSETSRWNDGKDMCFTTLRPERVVEVRYDYMEGLRFRHTTQFVRWRPDREPRSCTYDQLERPVRFNLADVLTSE